jgi:N-acetylgalactosamine kinase
MTVSEFQKLLAGSLTQLSLDPDEAGSEEGSEPVLRARQPLSATSDLCLRSVLFLLRSTYGRGELVAQKVQRMIEQCGLFLDSYGDGPVGVLRVPARINLLGEHVDYVSYIATASLTLGSREHDMILFFRPSEAGRIRGVSTLETCEPFSFDLGEGPPAGSGHEWESWLYSTQAPAPHWGNYVKAGVFYARMHAGERIRSGFDFAVSSTIPPAGGASSSSALTVLAGAAIRRSNHLPYEPAELARDSARAEWFVGTRGGSMDHITICHSRRMHSVHISYGEEAADLVPMTLPQLRWVTFFSRPANKGKEVMLEYNERAAVSRIIIPALIEEWGGLEGDHYVTWKSAVESARAGSTGALEEIERMLARLPQTITLARLEKRNPRAFGECRLAFPALVVERLDHPIAVRSRALHHVREVRRVAAAVAAFRDARNDADSGKRLMQRVGTLLNESHESLRDLYGVSTPDVEALMRAVAADPRVYGARLMGGGFGGNVLALTTSEHAPGVIESVVDSYYRPQGRDPRREGSVMVSTPGDGLSTLDCEAATRTTIECFNRRWRESETFRTPVCRMLDECVGTAASPGIWPVIPAAGKGARARQSGMEVPKPLAPVSGLPSIVRVLNAVRSSCSEVRSPVVVVSPETEEGVKAALKDEDVTIIRQARSLGTGDAVLSASGVMKDFPGRALVVWGTQPVIRSATIRRAIKLATIFPDYDMVLPTALLQQPYAPLLRDERGRITGACETHLEGAQAPTFGESNVGLFIIWNGIMFQVLQDLHRAFWQPGEGCYDRPGGELGFPNEMITHLAGKPRGVLASPIADRREEKGIKSRQDISICERYIRELEEESEV